MLPFFGETTVIAQQIPLPNATPTLAGTAVNIGGIPATIGTEAMKINPVFDWSPIVLAGGNISLPIWLFITAGFVLLLLWVVLSWIFRLRRLSGVRGYVVAAGKGTQEDMQVWIFGKTKKLTIECLKYWGGIIHYPVGIKISKWRHASIMATMNIGGVPAVAVSDDYDQTRDMVSEIALTEACEMFNSNQERLTQWAAENHLTIKIQPINSFYDYETFGREILGLVFPDGLPMKSFAIFNHTTFRKFFPKGRDADLSGGVFIRKARKLKPKSSDSGIIQKLLPIGLCVVFIGILMFGAMYVPLGK
jgi:hypothetical protein